jgi:hypothetical protein
MAAMRIAHLQVNGSKSGLRTTALARIIEGLRGVAGVVCVRSIGLLTVLYDERRTDPVVISEQVLAVEADGEGRVELWEGDPDPVAANPTAPATLDSADRPEEPRPPEPRPRASRRRGVRRSQAWGLRRGFGHGR